jgi:arylsulfatase A
MKPNIILINCDDLGYGDLGCYGSSKNESPNIDKLAEEGIQFSDFYMVSSVCSASRAGMLTGSYPPRLGIDWVLFPGDGCGLNPSEITIAKLLKESGYNTKIVGKWHCGDQQDFLPTNHGFDEYYGIPYSNDMGMQAKKDGTRNINPPLPLMREDKVIQEQPDQAAITERYVDECLDFIDRSKEEPFFLYLAHLYVHTPLIVPEHFLENSKNGRYGAAVASIDWATGVIMHALKKHNIDENTLVIFTSDNGGTGAAHASNGPLRGTKGTCFEGGQRVPCIMRWPEKIEAGRKENGIAASIDLYSTLANLGGAKVPIDRTVDGLDLSKLMLSNEQSPRDTFIYHSFGALQGVRKGPWKLRIAHQSFPSKPGETGLRELYNLVSDVGEENNVYDSNPEIVAELTTILDNAREDLGDKLTNTEGTGLRAPGKVENPVTLTTYDEDHPYIVAMYDMFDRTGPEAKFKPN